jgi:ethanolamine phosphate phosphodiesterase
MEGGNGQTKSMLSLIRFYDELGRFLKIFKVQREEVLTLGVAGNHDIGFGHTIVPHAYQRYLNTFGNLNTLTHVGNHSIIAIDTIGLSGKPTSVAYQTATEFLQGLENVPMHEPSRRILLSHVPLYRPKDSDCGSRRRAKPLTNSYGYQYQSN